MRVIITRHYKTLINAAEEILGWGDSPRDSGWKADVVYVSQQLRKHDIQFDAVYSSNLERARQTAMFHARRFGIHIVHDTPALNEVNYGKLYKKKKKWVAEHYPQHKKTRILSIRRARVFARCSSAVSLFSHPWHRKICIKPC